MKKLILIAIFALFISSCSPVRHEYECVIKYELYGVEICDTIKVNMSDKCTPALILGHDCIMISRLPSNMYGETKLIYKGNAPFNVTSFKFTLKRAYRDYL